VAIFSQMKRERARLCTAASNRPSSSRPDSITGTFKGDGVIKARFPLAELVETPWKRAPVNTARVDG